MFTPVAPLAPPPVAGQQLVGCVSVTNFNRLVVPTRPEESRVGGGKHCGGTMNDRMSKVKYPLRGIPCGFFSLGGFLCGDYHVKSIRISLLGCCSFKLLAEGQIRKGNRHLNAERDKFLHICGLYARSDLVAMKTRVRLQNT